MWGVVVSSVANAINGFLERRHKVKQAKLDLKLAKINTKAELVKKQKDQEHSWDMAQVDASQTSWKDEYITILISLPLILCFIPFTQVYIREGFIILNEVVPEWFLWSWGIVVSSAFGYKKFVNLLVNRKK